MERKSFVDSRQAASFGLSGCVCNEIVTYPELGCPSVNDFLTAKTLLGKYSEEGPGSNDSGG
jgi:hypothetical protein